MCYSVSLLAKNCCHRQLLYKRVAHQWENIYCQKVCSSLTLHSELSFFSFEEICCLTTFSVTWLFAPAMNNQIFLFLFSFLTAPTKASCLLVFSSDSPMLYVFFVVPSETWVHLLSYYIDLNHFEMMYDFPLAELLS
jgi:hypothetical protein